MKNYIKSLSILIGILFSMLLFLDTGYAQSAGCVAGHFGIDAGLYSGRIEYGSAIEPGSPSPRSNGWFQGAAGFGIISEANLAVIQALLQAPGNPTCEERMVGFMFRDSTSPTASDLWFVGLFNMAEPGGTSYMDFEFYVNPVDLRI